jgi:hypothetical protein
MTFDINLRVFLKLNSVWTGTISEITFDDESNKKLFKIEWDKNKHQQSGPKKSVWKAREIGELYTLKSLSVEERNRLVVERNETIERNRLVYNETKSNEEKKQMFFWLFNNNERNAETISNIIISPQGSKHTQANTFTTNEALKTTENVFPADSSCLQLVVPEEAESVVIVGGGGGTEVNSSAVDHYSTTSTLPINKHNTATNDVVELVTKTETSNLPKSNRDIKIGDDDSEKIREEWFQCQLSSEIDFSVELGSQQSLKERNPAKLVRCMTNYPKKNLKSPPKRLEALYRMKYLGYRAGSALRMELEEKNALYDSCRAIYLAREEEKRKGPVIEVDLYEKQRLDEIDAVICEIRKVKLFDEFVDRKSGHKKIMIISEDDDKKCDVR